MKPEDTPRAAETDAAFSKVQHFKEANQASFLASFRVTGNVSASCQASGIDRSTHYKWLVDDETYPERYKQAQADAADALEAEARRRAVEGVTEPVGWHQGQPGGYVQRYSDTLLIFLLKGALPSKYRERYEHSGVDGAPLRTEIVFVDPPAEEETSRIGWKVTAPTSGDASE